MDEQGLRELLQAVRRGERPVEEALRHLRRLPYENLGFARLDHHRALRTGLPEAVLAEGKTPAQAAEAAVHLATDTGRVLVTRASPAVYRAVRQQLPDAVYHPLSRLIVLQRTPPPALPGRCLVISAGTADLPVAEEAALCAVAFGCQVETLADVGVAGLHRLLEHLELLEQSNVLIVVAGMEGALASVVAGLTSRPVLAVPTSVGYGASFGGLAALLTMLNSCAPGVAVLNIDNGFGAAAMAYAILKAGESLASGLS